MDISKASITELLEELRSRDEVVSVKCWVLKDLTNWMDNEILALSNGEDHDEEDVKRIKFIKEHRDDIIDDTAGLLSEELDDCSNDWQTVDSVMYEAIERLRRESDDSERPDEGAPGA